MKLKKINEEYYLIDNIKISLNDWTNRECDVLHANLPEYVSFANEQKYPKIIASTQTNLGLPLIITTQVVEMLDVINKNKIWSDIDMIAFSQWCYTSIEFNTGKVAGVGLLNTYKEHLSNKQTEWDVEIEMEFVKNWRYDELPKTQPKINKQGLINIKKVF